MCCETSPPHTSPSLDHIEVAMPKDLMKEIALEDETTSWRQGEPRWKYLARKGVGAAYDIVSQPLRSSESITKKLTTPTEVTGPPTLGKAVGAVSDVVMDVASMTNMGMEESVLGKVAGGIGVAAITKTQRVKRWNELLVSLKKYKRGSKTIRQTLAGIKRLERRIPQELWDTVEDIKIDPKLEAMGQWGRTEAGDIKNYMKFNPKTMRPWTTFHETGHMLSTYLFEKSGLTGALSRVQTHWSFLSGQMGLTKEIMSLAHGLGRYGNLSKTDTKKLDKVLWLLYKGQPEEIFARTFERAMVKGRTLKDATQDSVNVVKDLMKAVQSFYDDAIKAGAGLEEKAKLSSIFAKIEKEIDGLTNWLDSPVFRRIDAEYKIGQLLQKRGFAPVGSGTGRTLRGTGAMQMDDVADIIQGWSFLTEKELRDIHGMLDEGKSLRSVRQKYPLNEAAMAGPQWLEESGRVVKSVLYGEDPEGVIEKLTEKGIVPRSDIRRPRDIVSDMGKKPPKKPRKLTGKERDKALDEWLAAGKKFGPGGELRYKHKSDEALYKIIKDARAEKKRTIVTKATVERHRDLKMKVLDATD